MDSLWYIKQQSGNRGDKMAQQIVSGKLISSPELQVDRRGAAAESATAPSGFAAGENEPLCGAECH